MLEMKEHCGMDSQEMTHMPAQGFYGEVALWRGTPARELKPTAAYRLGVDKRGG
jgi:hypothetical protein